MTRKYPGKKPVFLICIIFALFITGCNMLRPTAPKEESEKKKNPPKALTQMEKETDGIIQDLEEVQEKRAKQLREIENPSKERPPEQPDSNKATAGPKPVQQGRKARKTAGRAGLNRGPGSSRPEQKDSETAIANTTAYTEPDWSLNPLHSLMNNGTILNLQPSPTGHE